MITLKGIIRYYDQGRKCVDVVFTREGRLVLERKQVGVDVPVNRGTIESLLARLDTERPARIVWPHHIKIGAL